MRRTLQRWLAITGVSLALMVPTQAQSVEYKGPARIVDGDTVIISGVRIRFFGIDAPETKQTCLDARGRRYACGQRSTAYLHRLVGGRPVRCVGTGGTSLGRPLARCYVGKTDLQAAMARAGHAVAYLRHGTDYSGNEAQARAARRGLWQGKFKRPRSVRNCRNSGMGTIASCS
ncbi:MAG: thermonuclease family protein [Hyphomicrobiaceae bacterium]|nr:thermonuclease family protein [Hyphomicrobiaceae bacterium]